MQFEFLVRSTISVAVLVFVSVSVKILLDAEKIRNTASHSLFYLFIVIKKIIKAKTQESKK